GHVRPALGPREAERGLCRRPRPLRGLQVRPARERLREQLLDVARRCGDAERADRLDVRGRAAEQRKQRRRRLATVERGVLDLVREAALLELHLVELGGRDVALPRPRLAHADGLAVALQVLLGEPEPLARLEQRDETRAHLEGELPFEIRSLLLRRRPAVLGRLYARPPLAPQRDLLLDADRRRDGLAHAEPGRVRLPER